LQEKIDIAKVRHDGEVWSFIIMLLTSVVALLVLVVSVVGLVWLLVFVIIELFLHRLMMAFFYANSVKVTESQYPVLYRLAREYTARLGLKRVPDIYIIQQTTLNAFATRAARRNVVVVFSHTVETMIEQEQTDALGMVLGHEMGHLAANHLRWAGIFGGAALINPLFYLFWSRCCEYTADRLGYLCVGSASGASEGLLKLTVGKQMARVTDMAALAQQYNSVRKNFFVRLSELVSTHPHLLNRIHRLRDFSEKTTVSPAPPAKGVTA